MLWQFTCVPLKCLPHLAFVLTMVCGQVGTDLLFAQPCARQPQFIQALGFDLQRSAFSTSDRYRMGLLFIEFESAANPVTYSRIYQHPSWRRAGYLGPIVFDDSGNIYTAPLPMVNTLHNPVQEKNFLFRVDARTGEMRPFGALPVASAYHPHNPFGIIGMTYDCVDKVLYVSTVEGSSPQQELGRIFRFDPRTRQSTLLLDSTDAFGLAVITTPEGRQLAFGSARKSVVYSLSLQESSGSSLKPQPIINLTGLGPRGDDKVRKIRQNGDGTLTLYAVEFNYNLTAPAIRQEEVLNFGYDAINRTWKRLDE